MGILGVDHLQLAMPPGRTDDARAFYVGVLQLVEVPKAPELAGRDGVWFTAGNLQIHLGEEPGFRPSSKAHPAFVVDDLDGFLARYQQTGREVSRDTPLAGRDRVHVLDPFGNRIELLQLHSPRR